MTTRTVTMTVVFTVEVPGGVDPDRLCLAVAPDAVGIATTRGEVVEGAAVMAFTTIAVEASDPVTGSGDDR
jgi:hypothetical protein